MKNQSFDILPLFFFVDLRLFRFTCEDYGPRYVQFCCFLDSDVIWLKRRWSSI